MTFYKKWQLGCSILLVMVLIFGFIYGRNNTMATINGKAISRQEFYKILEEKNGSQVLGEMILKSLVEQEARKAGVRVSNEEIETEIAAIRQNFQNDYCLTCIMQYGMTLDQFKEETRYSLLLEKLRTQHILVSDTEMQEYYEQHKDSYVIPAQYRVAHIMVSQKQVAEDILKQLKDGKDFAALAKSKSEDTESKNSGGELGYFDEDSLPEIFSEEVLKLKVGQNSGIIKSEYGYHIVRLTEKLDAKQLAFDEVKSHVERIAKLNKAVSESDYIRQLKMLKLGL